MTEHQNTLVVTDSELDIIMKCIVEQPYKIVAPIVAKLVGQANATAPAAPAQPQVPGISTVAPGITSAVQDALTKVEGAVHDLPIPTLPGVNQ